MRAWRALGPQKAEMACGLPNPMFEHASPGKHARSSAARHRFQLRYGHKKLQRERRQALHLVLIRTCPYHRLAKGTGQNWL